MGRLTVNGLDGIIDDFSELAKLPDSVITDILNAEADVIVQAQRTEIESRWKGPHSLGISAKSVKKGKVKMGGILPPALSQTRRTQKEGALPLYKGEPVRIGRLVKADLTVNLASGKLFADDALAESVDEFTSGSIAMETDDLEDENAAVLYGAMVTDGAVRYNVGDDPPADGPAYFKKFMRRKKVLYKSYFYPLVKAALSNDTAQADENRQYHLRDKQHDIYRICV